MFLSNDAPAAAKRSAARRRAGLQIGECAILPRAKGVKNADYEAKRRELLHRMLPRFVRLDLGRPSLRSLAAAAQVTAPTLQHYFGDRSGVVIALLQEIRRLGEPWLDRLARPAGPFAASVREFAAEFVAGMQARGRVRPGDALAASLAESLADPAISPAALTYVIDPALDALAARLQRHVDSGEMIHTDLRAAALMLLSPLLVAVLHQDQMGGRASRRLELARLAEQAAQAFVRAYGRPAAPGQRRAGA